MTPVEITYEQTTYHRKLASTWDEMTNEQLIAYCYVLSLNLPAEQVRETILYRWLKVKPKVFFNMPVGIIEELGESLEFLFELDIASDKLILDVFTWKLMRYWGPGKGFCNLTVGELAYAETYMQQYMETKEQKYMDMLVVVLYRRCNSDTLREYKENFADPRPLFNDRLIDKHVKTLSSLPIYVKQAAFFNFLAYHQFVIKNNPGLYKKASDNSSGDGWAGVIHSMAGPELGTIDDVEKMTFNNALVILRKLENDRKRFEMANTSDDVMTI